MLNGAFAFNGGAALWANAPMPEHNSNAQRLMSACLPKQPLLSFLANKQYILPPSRLESLGRHVIFVKTPRARLSRRQHELFRLLRFGNEPLAFYRDLKRPTEHVVVSNCLLSDQH